MTSPKFHGATGQGTLSSRGPRLSTIVVLAICSMNLARDGVYNLTNAYRRESEVHSKQFLRTKTPPMMTHSLVSPSERCSHLGNQIDNRVAAFGIASLDSTWCFPCTLLLACAHHEARAPHHHTSSLTNFASSIPKTSYPVCDMCRPSGLHILSSGSLSRFSRKGTRGARSKRKTFGSLCS